MIKLFALAWLLVFFAAFSAAAPKYEFEVLETSGGSLKITFLGHGSLLFTFGEKTIYVDPVSQYADFGQFPKADLILLTHEHFDHLDPKALDLVRTDKTVLVGTEACAKALQGVTIMPNGDRQTALGKRPGRLPRTLQEGGGYSESGGRSQRRGLGCVWKAAA